MNLNTLSDAHYGLWFGVRRSLRYHDRRRAFFEHLHHLTSVLTLLLAGSVLFDLAKSGDTAPWMVVLSTLAALLAALDMVIGYAKTAENYRSLRNRFADLEIAMLEGDQEEATWIRYAAQRLSIEKDEPPVYRVLNLLCHNELLRAEGFCKKADFKYFSRCSRWQIWTSQLFRWENAPY